ncbi:hypothetical protein [Winogradskyella aurantia]|uniref:hypothetical protein n=1 Tax=Winogradskyella aurantia TaxID=1915063 RepID=UPI000BA1B4F8|nr:hypothetical protein [Winogradskyella aurantia]
MKNLTIALVLLFSSISFSQDNDAAATADALAKKLQNPVANLISVPLQNNFDFRIGEANGDRYTLNIQPVVPISISEKWNLIGRAIIPVISQNDVFGFSGAQTGLGDIVLSGFFSPKTPTAGGFIWGAGPAILAPTATDDFLGTGKLGLGPTAVVLKQAGSFTYGALANHIWSVAGNSERNDLSLTFIQPFIAKNFTGGYALTLNTEFTQNWDFDTSSGFLHLIGSKVVTVGKQMSQIFIGPRVPYGNGNTAEWGIRGGITLLFPTK